MPSSYDRTVIIGEVVRLLEKLLGKQPDGERRAALQEALKG